MKSSTLPASFTAAKLSNIVLLLLHSNILSNVVARSSQKGFLDFCRKNLNPLPTFPSMLMKAGNNFADPLTFRTSKKKKNPFYPTFIPFKHGQLHPLNPRMK